MLTQRRVVIAILTAMAVTSVGCGDSSATVPGSSLTSRSLDNVKYGTDAQQIMDVRLPAKRTSATAVVVFIHGGGWEGGDKSIFIAADIDKFLAAGYACVNINYRLASVPLNVHDPVLSDDVTLALDYVAAHASDYVVSGSTFALIGHSAGAHLALLAAYKYNASRRIKAVASLSGPTDFNASDFLAIGGVPDLLERYLGVTRVGQPARFTAASPVSQATSGSPPTIILHGQKDVIVPFSQAASLHAKLLSLGVADDYRLFPAYDHDLSYATILRFPDDVWNPTLAWFAKYVK